MARLIIYSAIGMLPSALGMQGLAPTNSSEISSLARPSALLRYFVEDGSHSRSNPVVLAESTLGDQAYYQDAQCTIPTSIAVLELQVARVVARTTAADCSAESAKGCTSADGVYSRTLCDASFPQLLPGTATLTSTYHSISTTCSGTGSRRALQQCYQGYQPTCQGMVSLCQADAACIQYLSPPRVEQNLVVARHSSATCSSAVEAVLVASESLLRPSSLPNLNRSFPLHRAGVQPLGCNRLDTGSVMIQNYKCSDATRFATATLCLLVFLITTVHGASTT